MRHAADGALVSRDAPIQPGETVLITATGGGAAEPRATFDGVEGKLLAAVLTAESGLYELRVETSASLPRRFPTVIVESPLGAAPPVSAGGPGILDVASATVRLGGDVTVRIRGVNFPAAPVLRVGDGEVAATLLAGEGQLQALQATIPAFRLAAGRLALQVADSAAAAEEASNPVPIAVAQ